MSTLKDFIRHDLDSMPGPAPEPPVPPKKAAQPCAPQKAGGAAEPSVRAAKARAQGALKGDLFYTQAQAHPSVKGWVESDGTVDHKLCSKEEFPQG